MITIIFTAPWLTHTDDIPEMSVALQLSADNLRWLLDKAKVFTQAHDHQDSALTQHVYRTNDIHGFQLLTCLRHEDPADVTQDPAAAQTWWAEYEFDTGAKEPSFRLATATKELPWLPEDEDNPFDEAVIVTVVADGVYLGRSEVNGPEENSSRELEVCIATHDLEMLWLEATATGKEPIA